YDGTFDSLGNYYAAYTTNNRVYVRMRDIDKNWADAELLYDYSEEVVEGDLGITHIQVLTDSLNQPHVIWGLSANECYDPIDKDHRGVYYAFHNGSQWSDAVFVADTGDAGIGCAPSFSADMVIDAHDDVYIVGRYLEIDSNYTFNDYLFVHTFQNGMLVDQMNLDKESQYGIGFDIGNYNGSDVPVILYADGNSLWYQELGEEPLLITQIEDGVYGQAFVYEEGLLYAHAMYETVGSQYILVEKNEDDFSVEIVEGVEFNKGYRNVLYYQDNLFYLSGGSAWQSIIEGRLSPVQTAFGGEWLNGAPGFLKTFDISENGDIVGLSDDYRQIDDNSQIYDNSRYIRDINVFDGHVVDDYAYAPDPVYGVRAEATTGPNVITWNAYNDVFNNFDHYTIYRWGPHYSFTSSLNDVELVAEIDDMSVIEYQDELYNDEKPYYTVIAYATDGSHGVSPYNIDVVYGISISSQLNQTDFVEGTTVDTSFSLEVKPKYDVTLSFNVTEGNITFEPSVITVGPDNWENIPVTITALAVDENYFTEGIAGDIINISGESEFRFYQGDLNNVGVRVLDMDIPLINGSMEQLYNVSNDISQTRQWITYGQPSMTNAPWNRQLNSRVLSVDASNRGAGVQQRGLNVEAGETYQLRFKYNLEQGRLFPKLGNNDSERDFEGNRDRVYPTNGEWKEYTRVFTAPESEDFRLVFAGKDAVFLIDDVIIELYDDRNLVKDGDMKLLGTDEWRYWNNKTAFSKSEGNNYMVIDAVGISAGFQQLNLPVEAGKEYRLSFDYQKFGGRFRTILGIGTSNSDFESRYDFFPKTYNGNWKQYERTFTVPEDFDGDFRLVFLQRNGISHVHDVRIEEVLSLQVHADAYENTIASAIDGEVSIGQYDISATGGEILVEELTVMFPASGKTYIWDMLSEVALFDEEGNELDRAAPIDGNKEITFHVDESIEGESTYTLRGIVNTTEDVPADAIVYTYLDNRDISAFSIDTGEYLWGDQITVTQ
ncbi:MAG: hypothetical protein HOG08_04855, partial [Candidatus Magasanikbacteria bacterium]|nr:hypothetical protein [Candidatus Magasanikbacteria bacterium]